MANSIDPGTSRLHIASTYGGSPIAFSQRVSFQLGVGLLAFMATLTMGLAILIVRLWRSMSRPPNPPRAVAAPAAVQESWHSDTVAFLLSGQSDIGSPAQAPTPPAAPLPTHQQPTLIPGINFFPTATVEAPRRTRFPAATPEPSRAMLTNAAVDEAIDSLEFDDETVCQKRPRPEMQKKTLELDIGHIERLLFQCGADD